MRLTFADNSIFKDCISIISDLVSEGSFKFTKSGVEFIAMDPANVSMVILKLFPTCFKEYDLDKEIEINLDLNNLKQILKRAKMDDLLTLEVVSEDKLNIVLRSSILRSFTLPLLSSESPLPKIPNFNFSASIAMPSELLEDAIEDAGIVAESATFIADKDKLVILAEGETSKSKFEAGKDEAKVSLLKDGKVKAKYSIEYLKKMVVAAKLSSNAEIRFSQDYPIKLEYKALDKVYLSFILAPRADTD